MNILNDSIDVAVDAASGLICAVHDFDREAVAELLEPLDVLQLRALAVVLAAAIEPETTSLKAALHWVDGDEPKPRAVPMRRRQTVPAGWTTQEISEHRAALSEAASPRRRQVAV